jgi:hypothetical protein
MVSIIVPKRSLNAWPWLLKRNILASIHRIKGIKEETVIAWLREAANHVEEIKSILLANYPLTRVQLDAMWTYVGHKGEKADIPKMEILAEVFGAHPSDVEEMILARLEERSWHGQVDERV